MNAKAYLQQLLQTETPATLQEILDGKEARVQKQRDLLEQGETLICFTLNIPGAYKRSALLDQGFQQGCELILQQLRWNHIPVLKKEKKASHAGCELYVLCDEDAFVVKGLMVQIEEEHPLGRLLDIDVLGKKGDKISRRELGMAARRCLLCEETAAACGRSRKHSYEELLLKMIQILQEYFAAQFMDRVACNAARALLYEVSATPKPGLVDRDNSGSHKDMDLFTFIDSTAILSPHFRSFVQKGRELANCSVEQILPQLRYPGYLAEDSMRKITKGVNCHKGIIFSMGVICCAIGMRYEQGLEYDTSETLHLSGKICSHLMEDFKAIKEPRSHGERLFVEYGIKGIRGEASEGYPTVERVGLSALKRYVRAGFSLNDAGVWTLLDLLCDTEDSNILARSNMDTLKAVQKQAKDILMDPNPRIEQIQALDQQFIEKNISPGGCADLLALCYFLYFMEESMPAEEEQ